jgi:hypothetical protein
MARAEHGQPFHVFPSDRSSGLPPVVHISVSGGTMHGRKKQNPFVGLLPGVERAHRDAPLRIRSRDGIDELGLVVLCGIERGLVINTPNQVQSNGINSFEMSSVEPLLYVLWLSDNWPWLDNLLAWEEQPTIVALVVDWKFHDIAKSFAGLIQTVNTTYYKVRPEAHMFCDRVSDVSYRDVKHQHASSLIEDEIRRGCDVDGNPRPMGQLKLCLGQLGLPSGLLSQFVCVLSSSLHQAQLALGGSGIRSGSFRIVCGSLRKLFETSSVLLHNARLPANLRERAIENGGLNNQSYKLEGADPN